jgi:hypothetical protein
MPPQLFIFDLGSDKVLANAGRLPFAIYMRKIHVKNQRLSLRPPYSHTDNRGH